MTVAVVGATGMVGNVMLKVLAERNFPLTELIPVASERSVGKKVAYRGTDYTVVGLQTAVDMQPDVALFSEFPWQSWHVYYLSTLPRRPSVMLS